MNINQKSSEAAYLDLQSKYGPGIDPKSSEAAYLDLRSKYKSSKYKLFSLIEVALALAIVALGVVSIMALFPVGFQASRDAMGDNYSADAADQMLHILSIDSSFCTVELKQDSTANEGSGFASLPMIQNGSIYERTGADPGIFGAKQGSPSVTDFSAILRVWRETIDINSDGVIDADDIAAKDFCTRFCLEISWPPEKPYEQRVKKLYAMEAFYPE